MKTRRTLSLGLALATIGLLGLATLAVGQEAAVGNAKLPAAEAVPYGRQPSEPLGLSAQPPVAGTTIDLKLENHSADDAVVYLCVSLLPGEAPVRGGFIVIAEPVVWLGPVWRVRSEEALTVDLEIPEGFLGQRLYLQAIGGFASHKGIWAVSNGLRLTIGT